ncbi:MAG: DUF805 domain-containing protein [Actinobacteria bacterium]|nr:DUF805 domain-containing protein [Actinomycetota bacterium]MCB8996640.1 DUF805 domain-containing protein [Actinomycetota bacterium]HRY10801.1 DUF805 domain-containing protein [Candidatus Nanopelagicales bacterium]
MSFGQAISSGFKKYAVFRGRASRSEFWYWVLFYIIVSFILNILDNLFGFQVSTVTNLETGDSVTSVYNPGWLSSIWALVVLLPTISIAVRRLHDVNKSGWWWWLGLICCIGPLILIFAFYIKEGDAGDNNYGPPPGSPGAL